MTLTPKSLLERKEALGRIASYHKLSSLAGVSHTTIFRVLTEKESGLPIDRTAVLRKVDEALCCLENELQEAA